ncbi:MAG: NAD-dependent epimerase/dehydratase family protein [Brooklawnia sp.]|jgi:nucleoside-diphosphate-sugar epimerase
MHLLITGTNGFVGGAIVRAAHRRGWQVTGVGRQGSPNPVRASADAWPDRYLQADLAAGFAWTPDRPVDAVVHCAALSSPWAAPDRFTAANLGGTNRVLEWSRTHGNLPLVFISSPSVLYTDADQYDLTEASPVVPDEHQINLYSRSKAQAERMVERYPGRWTTLRPRAVFGPGDPVLLPRVLQAARAGRLPIITRRDPDPVVCDLTHVDVVGEYVARAVERQASGPFNLTNGSPVPLYPFLFRLFERLGIPRPRRRVPVRVAMAAARVAEEVSARARDYREPMITRYGISMFAWSKTFDIWRTREVLGEPLMSLTEGVDDLVESYLTN